MLPRRNNIEQTEQDATVVPRRRVRYALAARQHSLVNEIAFTLPPHQRYRFLLRVSQLVTASAQPISDNIVDAACDRVLRELLGDAA